jgi:hypothetical protein
LNKSDQNKDHRNCVADLNNDQSNHEIVFFLGENEMTNLELDCLRSHGTVSEVEVLKLGVRSCLVEMTAEAVMQIANTCPLFRSFGLTIK